LALVLRYLYHDSVVSVLEYTLFGWVDERIFQVELLSGMSERIFRVASSMVIWGQILRRLLEALVV
jgi:hypothetical protein